MHREVRQGGVRMGAERIEDFTELLAVRLGKARKPEPHPDAFDPARNARAALISGDQPASSELRNEPCSASSNARRSPIVRSIRSKWCSATARWAGGPTPSETVRSVCSVSSKPSQRTESRQTELPGNVREESELRSVHPPARRLSIVRRSSRKASAEWNQRST